MGEGGTGKAQLWSLLVAQPDTLERHWTWLDRHPRRKQCRVAVSFEPKSPGSTKLPSNVPNRILSLDWWSVIAALAAYRNDERTRARLGEAVAERSDTGIAEAFGAAFA